MNRIFLRENNEEENYFVYEKYKLGIVGMGAGAGATFIGTSLAFFMSKNKEKPVAFAEIGAKGSFSGSTYDMLGMNKRFAGRVFNDFAQLISEGENIKKLQNIDANINWALRQTAEARALSIVENLKLINNLKGSIIICDFNLESFEKDEEGLTELLSDMDGLAFVVDPLPSKLLSAEKLLACIKRFENRGMPVTFVLNRLNPGINKRELAEFLKIRKYVKIPEIESRWIYESEYNCRIPYEMKAIREKIHEGIEEIANLHKIYI